jgi:prevent-host-death family protein
VNRIGIREAKAQLSKLLRDVRRGEEWIITERGRPIAKLSAVSTQAETDAEWVARLEREGRLIPLPPGARMPRPLDIEPSDVAQRLLREDRDAGP